MDAAAVVRSSIVSGPIAGISSGGLLGLFDLTVLDVDPDNSGGWRIS